MVVVLFALLFLGCSPDIERTPRNPIHPEYQHCDETGHCDCWPEENG